MGYRDRVLRDLVAWREAGWVTEAGAEAIAASLPERRSIGFAGIIGMLGAILIAAGVVAFIAANWEEIPRLWRLILAVVIMVAGFVAAGPLAQRHGLFGQGALLVAAAGFAGLLALIGQTYNMGPEFIDVIGLWAGGVLAGALLLASPVLTILGVAGGAVWSANAVAETQVTVHVAGLLPIVAGGAIAVWLGSAAARQLAVLALSAWLVITAIALGVEAEWEAASFGAVTTLAALALLAAALAVPRLIGGDAMSALGRASAWPAIVLTLAGLAILQVAEEPAATDRAFLVWCGIAAAVALVGAIIVAVRGGRTAGIGIILFGAASLAFALAVPNNMFTAGLIGAAITLAATVWTVALGREGLVPGGAPLGLIAFGLEVIYVYSVTIGTILDTSLVFFGGGILFIALAFVLYRVQKRLAGAST